MTNKVIWHEGMFLRPQHFQQYDQYLLKEINNRTRTIAQFNWGFSRLKINESNLKIGELSLDDCAGSFTDGTCFDMHTGDAPPLPILVDDSISDAVVYLAIPLQQQGVVEVGSNDNRNSLVRYLPKSVEVADIVSSESERTNIQVGELRLRMFVEDARQNSDNRVPDGYTRLAIAHIEEVKGGQIRLRQQFISPLQSIGASDLLLNFLTELQSMLTTRARELAARVSSSGGKGGVAEVTDFMLLQLLNRFDPLLTLYRQVIEMAPLELYERLLQLTGELATFMKPDKRPIEFNEYQQDNLIETFRPVMEELKSCFGTVLEQIAESIPLSPSQYGIRAARIRDRVLLKSADFIFAVSAQVGQEKLRTQFPQQIKIGPVERIRELITSALPGVPISPLPVAPREIPYHAGFTYFQLDTSHEIWKELDKSGGIAFHIGGEFPGLECQFWAIKRR
ncbi:type VI secretion system baseplate subunit TssK [Amphritea japonica]|uniref:Type VI secretion system protein ImpJ n=1 Tax=Amphritea japonica ATCC BAA-1530 TaxID=1278309 RepID=A0A7R6P1P9_9GAMM|nr:type VI secretion system baseplate subunit TssK [Amphritea japonica]BBB25279.1 type VI secretion system protein ImpJ [Amphritea japonica ATCC BAA-1530]